MRILIKALASVALLILLAQAPALAHGRSYTGPRGGGTPGFDFSPPGTHTSHQGRDSSTDWDWWWDLHQDRFLRTERSAQRWFGSVGLRGEDDLRAPPSAAALHLRQEAIEVLLGATRDSYFSLRAAAIIAMGKSGDGGEPELTAAIKGALKDRDQRVVWCACLALGLLGSMDHVPLLLEIARGNQSIAREVFDRSDVPIDAQCWATVAIGLIGHRHPYPSDHPIVLELLQMARRLPMREDEDPPIGPGQPYRTKSRWHSAGNSQRDLAVGAAVALQLMRIDGAAEALLEIANDASVDDYVRSHILIGLGKCGAKRVAPRIVQLLEDRMPHVSRSAAIALGLLGDRNDIASIAALQRTARSAEDLALRNFAIIALGEIGAESGRSTLVSILRNSPSANDRSYASLAIGIMAHAHGERAQGLGPVILWAYRAASSDSERGAHAVALGLLREESALPALRRDLSDPQRRDLAPHLCTALGLLGDGESLAQLRQILANRKLPPDTRHAAALSLASLGDQASTPELARVLAEDFVCFRLNAGLSVALGSLVDRSDWPGLQALAVRERRWGGRGEQHAYAVAALGVLADKDAVPLLPSMRHHANYLAQTLFLAELFRIL